MIGTATETLKSTPLTAIHEAAGARMVPFAGYRMPVQYSGIIPEHRAVRSSVGIFDLSHMGEIEVQGPGMLDFLEKVTTNNVASVKTYQCQYSLMLTPEGGIVDDLVLYHLPEGAMLVVNAANIEKDFAWLKDHCPKSVQLTNRSDDIALIAIQGPNAQDVASKLFDCDLDEIEYYHAAEGTVNGQRVIFSRTGYTGEDGFEIYVPNELAESCWTAALEVGADAGIMPIGLGARDTLRMEMKYALYGNDIDDTTNPIDAGLGWVVALDKPADFIGKAKVLEHKTNGPLQKLIAFTMDEKAIPRSHCEIRVDNQTVGQVTSGTHSPSLDKGIGMGYVAAAYSRPGTTIEVVIREKGIPATVIKPPFVRNTSHR